jgi:hypothetical protein
MCVAINLELTGNSLYTYSFISFSGLYIGAFNHESQEQRIRERKYVTKQTVPLIFLCNFVYLKHAQQEIILCFILIFFVKCIICV